MYTLEETIKDYGIYDILLYDLIGKKLYLLEIEQSDGKYSAAMHGPQTIEDYKKDTEKIKLNLIDNFYNNNYTTLVKSIINQYDTELAIVSVWDDDKKILIYKNDNLLKL
tara:strand:+ start:108 stop:437 length:330 start_codon:yes stop_codon:yes gene_type:complete